MVSRKLLIAILSIMLLPLALFLGCSGDDGAEGPVGPQGPPGPPGPTILKPFIVCEVQAPWGGDPRTDCDMSISYLSGRPTADLNGTNIPFRYWDEDDNNARLYDYHLPDAIGDSVLLTVEFPKSDATPGAAYARGVIPGSFEIVSHDTSITNGTFPGDSLRLHWSTSADADAYRLDLYVSYYYELASGDTGYFVLDCDTFLADTTVFFPDTRLYPLYDDMVGIWSFNQYVYAYSYNGPVLPGDQANVTGDAIGVMFCENYGGYLDFAYLVLSASPTSPTAELDKKVSLLELLTERFDPLAR